MNKPHLQPLGTIEPGKREAMSKTILIVDDSLSLRLVVKMTLEGAGHTVCKPLTANKLWTCWMAVRST
jgi:DNA-binding NtrC family response regulator